MTEKKKNIIKWVKSLGMGAFLFFFIKGLVWIAIFLGAFKIFSCG